MNKLDKIIEMNKKIRELAEQEANNEYYVFVMAGEVIIRKRGQLFPQPE